MQLIIAIKFSLWNNAFMFYNAEYIFSGSVNYIASTLLTVLLTIVLTILLQDFFEDMLSRIRGKIPLIRRPDVRGVWKAKYSYIKNGKPKTVHQLIKINRIGSRVFGRTIRGKEAFPYIYGKLEGINFISGRWQETLDSNHYFGVFQLYLSHDGKTMSGQWLGFNSHNEIQNGSWEFERI